MTTQPQKYSVYSIRGLPAGVWGESYAVVAAFESSTNELTTEFFILTKRPKEALHSGSLIIPVTPLPPGLGKIDLEFALQEGLHETELLLISLLEARAIELSRPDVAYLKFELIPTMTGNLLSCWMRGQYNSQLREIQTGTKCRPLAQYLSLYSQVGIIIRTC